MAFCIRDAKSRFLFFRFKKEGVALTVRNSYRVLLPLLQSDFQCFTIKNYVQQNSSSTIPTSQI